MDNAANGVLFSKRTAQILDQNRHGWNNTNVIKEWLEIISVNADDN